jgi:UDP-N-acetylmuramate--alanine ligase
MDAPSPIAPETLDKDICLAPDFLRPRRAHLIGVAGCGMRALADVLAGWGWQLTGSDLRLPSDREFGGGKGQWFKGHSPDHLAPETELVVYSDAIPAGNPELRRAVELGIPTVSYFEMVGQLTADRHTVAVTGTHGKSTTTAMLAHILTTAGHDPTVFCGATPLGATSGGRAGASSPLPLRAYNNNSPLPLGEGQGVRACRTQPALTLTLSQREMGLAIVEACEYRKNFLHLRPKHATILGIEPDHFDCYDSLDELERAFRQFAASVPADASNHSSSNSRELTAPGEGYLLVRHDCESTRRATAGVSCRVESFGLCPDADWSAHDIKPRPAVAPGSGATTGRGFMDWGPSTFEIRHLGQPFCQVQLQVPGRHNMLNALAAAALAWNNGVTADQIAAGLGSFPGLHRRLERLGTWRGVTVLDDYAHHPTEISVTLETIRRLFPRRRVWCVFQPHQASRTARLLEPLAASLQNADKVLVADIFRAREGSPRPGEVTAADLARRTAALGVEVLPGHTAEEIVQTLETHLAPGDVLVTLGAGDVERLRPESRGERRGEREEA